jgi:MFS family permease
VYRVELPGEVKWIAAATGANSFGNGVALPFLPLYVHAARHFSLSFAAFALAVYALAGMAIALPVGRAVDAYGPRLLLRAALLTSAFGFALIAFAHARWSILAGAAVAGMGNAGFWPSHSTFISRLMPASARHRGFSLDRAAGNLGLSAGVVAGGVLAGLLGYPALFLINAATFLSFFAIVSRIALPPNEAGEPRHADAGPSYRALLADRAVTRVLALRLVAVAAGYAQLDMLALFANGVLRVGALAVGLVFAANTVANVVLQVPISRVVEGHRRLRLYAAFAIVWSGCWLGVFLVGRTLVGVVGAVALGLIVVLFAVGESVETSTDEPLIVDLAPVDARGRYMTASSLAWQIGLALGTTSATVFLRWSPTGIWLMSSATCFALAVLALRFSRLIPTEIERVPTSAVVGVAS